jgi:hypothetical protein
VPAYGDHRNKIRSKALIEGKVVEFDLAASYSKHAYDDVDKWGPVVYLGLGRYQSIGGKRQSDYTGNLTHFFRYLTKEEKQMKENKMPELKAGMVIYAQWKSNAERKKYYLYVNDNLLLEGGGEWLSLNDVNILAVYYQRPKPLYNATSPKCCTEENLAWQAKSPTQIKIEELKKTISEASDQLQELEKTVR